MNNTVVWLSIFEYSKQFKKSISTIRRYIKSGKLITKTVEGKYYIQSSGEQLETYNDNNDEEVLKLKEQILFLKKQLVTAREEIGELRMLVDLYEKDNLPEIPAIPNMSESQRHLQ